MIVTQRAHLRLVTDTDDPAEQLPDDRPGFRDALHLFLTRMLFVWRCLTFPFRAVAALWRAVVAFGIGVVRGAFNAVFAMIGVVFGLTLLVAVAAIIAHVFHL